MRGSPELGGVLTGLRLSQGLSQAQVATRVCCDPSLISMLESGKRVLHRDLAGRLDQLYGTGGTLASLATSRTYPRTPGRATLDAGDVVVLVDLPLRGVTVPVPRRALLAALTIGATATALPDVRGALMSVPADDELLAEMTQSLQALHSAGSMMPPDRLIDTLLGHIAVLDVVRIRAPSKNLRRRYLMLQAQYAETSSWMAQESGDLQKAAHWVDRGQQWAADARWPAMDAYAHVRRSALASTFADDGELAVGHALRALRTDDVPLRVRAQATKQMAYGYALAGNSEACHRALDQTGRLLGEASVLDAGPDPVIALAIADVPNALAQFEGTCDVYLGAGERAISLIGPVRCQAGTGSRNHAVTGARLARAHAQAGDPEQACALALAALETGQALDSWTTRIELRRALAPLGRWPGREDVAEVRHRVTALG